VNGTTHDEAKRLANMIRSPDTRQEITAPEWRAIADIVRKHERPRGPPLLEDRDYEANRVKLAEHSVAYNVLEEQKMYRKRHNCKRVPGTETNAMLDDFINVVAESFRIEPQRLTKKAILTIVKNRRPSARKQRLFLRPDEAYIVHRMVRAGRRRGSELNEEEN
jgi:hypothetical protein